MLCVCVASDPSRYRGLLFDRTNMSRVRVVADCMRFVSFYGPSISCTHTHSAYSSSSSSTPYDLSIHIYPSSPTNASGSSSFFFFLRDSVCKLSPSITFPLTAHMNRGSGVRWKIFATADNDARPFFFIKGSETGSVSNRTETFGVTAAKKSRKTRKLTENENPLTIHDAELVFATPCFGSEDGRVLIASKDKRYARARQFFLPEFSTQNFFQCTDFFVNLWP